MIVNTRNKLYYYKQWQASVVMLIGCNPLGDRIPNQNYNLFRGVICLRVQKPQYTLHHVALLKTTANMTKRPVFHNGKASLCITSQQASVDAFDGLTECSPDAASQLSVTANNVSSNLTVSEGDHVAVRCTAVGRPTPTLDLYNGREGGSALDSAVGGEMVVEDRGSSLNHVIQSATCRHTATYRCTARNDVSSGDGVESQVELSVLCECSYFDVLFVNAIFAADINK